MPTVDSRFCEGQVGNVQIIDIPAAGAQCTAPRWVNERGGVVGVYANTFQFHGFLLQQGDTPASIARIYL
jgi:hypothetical protein